MSSDYLSMADEPQIWIFCPISPTGMTSTNPDWVQEDLSELYEDKIAPWVFLHLLRADNLRLPPAARQMLQPPSKPRLAAEAAPAASLPDSDGVVASVEEVRAHSRP